MNVPCNHRDVSDTGSASSCCETPTSSNPDSDVESGPQLHHETSVSRRTEEDVKRCFGDFIRVRLQRGHRTEASLKLLFGERFRDYFAILEYGLQQTRFDTCCHVGADVRRLRLIRNDLEWAQHAEERRNAGLSPTPWEAFVQHKDKETRNTPYFTLVYVLCMFLVFLVDIGSNNWNVTTFFGDHRMLVQMGEHSTERIVVNNEWYRLLSCCVLHFDWAHLISNTVGVLLYGIHLEQRHGTAKTFFLCLFSSVGAGLFTSILNPDCHAVRASFAVYALLGISLADVWTNWDILVVQEKRGSTVVFSSLVLLFLASTDLLWQVILPIFNCRANLVGDMGGLFSGFCLALPFIDPIKTSGVFGDPRLCDCHRLLAAQMVCFATATFCLVLSFLILWRSESVAALPPFGQYFDICGQAAQLFSIICDEIFDPGPITTLLVVSAWAVASFFIFLDMQQDCWARDYYPPRSFD